MRGSDRVSLSVIARVFFVSVARAAPEAQTGGSLRVMRDMRTFFSSTTSEKMRKSPMSTTAQALVGRPSVAC